MLEKVEEKEEVDKVVEELVKEEEMTVVKVVE